MRLLSPLVLAGLFIFNGALGSNNEERIINSTSNSELIDEGSTLPNIIDQLVEPEEYHPNLSLEEDTERIRMFTGANEDLSTESRSLVSYEADLYPSVATVEEVEAELDRIAMDFLEGKMTEATKIDLQVLIYQHHLNKLSEEGDPDSEMKLFNQILQLIDDVPEIAYNCIREALIPELLPISLIYYKLKIVLNGINPQIIKIVQRKYESTILMPMYRYNRSDPYPKTLESVLKRLNEEMPYAALNGIHSNLEKRMRLRFFMSIYGMSLQSQFIWNDGNKNFNIAYLHTLMYNAITVFNRAFPRASGEEWIEALPDILEDARAFISSILNGSIKKEVLIHLSEVCIYGLYDTADYIVTLGKLKKLSGPVISMFFDNLAGMHQFKILKRVYQVLEAKSSHSLHESCLEAASEYGGLSTHFLDEISDIYDHQDLEDLLSNAFESQDMISVLNLLRVRVESYFQFSDIDWDRERFQSIRIYDEGIQESLLVEYTLIFPHLIEFDEGLLSVISEKYPKLARVLESIEVIRRKFETAYSHANDGIVQDFINLVDEIGEDMVGFFFRKILSLLFRRNSRDLVLFFFRKYAEVPGYVEEAADSALYVCNTNFLEFLVQNHGFQITKPFAKRWITSIFLDFNETKNYEATISSLLEFYGKFSVQIESFYEDIRVKRLFKKSDFFEDLEDDFFWIFDFYPGKKDFNRGMRSNRGDSIPELEESDWIKLKDYCGVEAENEDEDYDEIDEDHLELERKVNVKREARIMKDSSSSSDDESEESSFDTDSSSSSDDESEESNSQIDCSDSSSSDSRSKRRRKKEKKLKAKQVVLGRVAEREAIHEANRGLKLAETSAESS